jgi:hypothetical protein
MPLRDRKPSSRPTTAETLVQLEQQVTALREQVFERFELLQVQPAAPITSPTTYEREYELITLPFRGWDPGAILTAKSLADEGDLERAADLWESALADDRVAAAMEQRLHGLQGLPVRFTGDGEDVLTAISTDYWQMMAPGERTAMLRWGLGLGVCPVYVEEYSENAAGRLVPVLKAWNPRALRWRQGGTVGQYEWWIQTARGQVRLSDQPGRWFLFTPFSGAGQRPWVDGIWYSTATWWLAKSFGIADLASFSQSHATPKWFLMPKDGAQIDKADKQEAIRRLAALPQRSGMYIPAGFQVEQREATSTAWNAITALIDLANKALTVRILGTDSTTDKESSYASAAGGMQLLYAKFRTDADALAAFWHDGPLQYWYLLNFRGTRKASRKVLDMAMDEAGVYRLLEETERRHQGSYGYLLRQLSEGVRGGDEVPWPTSDATPPQDMAAVAETQGKAAAALVQLTAASANPDFAAAIAQIDLPRYLERFFPMREKDESGVQLEMEDGTIIELGKGKTGSGWITVNGAHIHAEPGKAIDFGALRATKGGAVKQTKESIAAAKQKAEEDWIKANTKPADPSDLEAWSKFAARPNATYDDKREARNNVDKAVERMKKDPSIKQIDYIAQHSDVPREKLVKKVMETKQHTVRYRAEAGMRAVDSLESGGVDGIPAAELKSGLDVARNKLLTAKSDRDFPAADVYDRPLMYVHQLNPKIFGSTEAVHARELRDIPDIPNVAGKKGTVVIATRDGEKDVSATIYDSKTAVHKGEKAGWTITHVNTGMQIESAGTKSEADAIAKRLAKEIEEPAFWSLKSASDTLQYRGDAVDITRKIASQERVRAEISAEAKKLEDVDAAASESDGYGDAAQEILELGQDPTDFPRQGDDKPVSLGSSGYAVFDPDYAEDIRQNWPDIWNAGGNDVEGTEHSGDDQYRRLKPVVARGGDPETDTEEEAIRRREAWAARHFKNHRLAGVVALMKWFVVGEIGESKMKAVMDAAKEAQMKLQQPRNVRAPLHEGLEFADETVGAMAAANPVVMDDITGQIVRVLADSRDYPDARQRLAAAFPTLDREALRNMLTGGLLIAQAAGMEGVQREGKA